MVVYIVIFNCGVFKVVLQGRVESNSVLYCVLFYGLFYFQMVDKKGKLVLIGNLFVMILDSIYFIILIWQIIVLNGIFMYDVKWVLELGYEVYILYYWKDGW